MKIASFIFTPKKAPQAATKTVVNKSWINPPMNTCLLIRMRSLRENSIPIEKSNNTTPNSANTSIDMQWEWIPLLDFSFSLFQIVKSLSNKENSFESFEFTESTENIKFVREGSTLKILPSFSPNTIYTTFDEFNNEVQTFHKKISVYIKENINEAMNKKSIDKFLFN